MRVQYSASILVLLALAILEVQLTAGKVACQNAAKDSCEAVDPNPEHAEAMLQVVRNPPHKVVVKDGAKHDKETRMTAESAKRADSRDDINEDARSTKSVKKSDHDRKTGRKETASSSKISMRKHSNNKQEDGLGLREKSGHSQHGGKKDEDLTERENADKKQKVGTGLRKKSGHRQNSSKKDNSSVGIKKRNSDKKQEDGLRMGEKYVQDKASDKKEKDSSSKVSKKDSTEKQKDDGLKLKERSNHETTSGKKDDKTSKASSKESSIKKQEEKAVRDHNTGKKGKDSSSKDSEEEKDDKKQEWEERQHKLEQELAETRSELLEAKGQRRALLQQLQDAESKAERRQAIFQQLADIEASEPRTIFEQAPNDEESKGNQLHIQEQDHEPTLAELLNKDLLSVEGVEFKSNDSWIMKSDEKNEDSDALDAQNDKSTDKAKDKEADTDTAGDDDKKSKQDASNKEEDEDAKKSNSEDAKKSNYDRLTQKGEGKASTDVTFEKSSKRSKDTKSTGKHSDNSAKGH